MYIDTHAHLYSRKYQDDRDAMVGRAEAAGLELILLPNVSSETIGPMLALCHDFPSLFRPMMGLHPTSVKPESIERELEAVRQALFAPGAGYVAVGEIGIDLYWDKSTLALQEEVFAEQMRWAVGLGLPVAIHARESLEEIFRVMERFDGPLPAGVFHCFSGSLAQAEKALALGFHLGIGGTSTYPKGGLERVLPQVPLERLLLETDAPYLAPVPHRGKRNESAYLPVVAQRVAALRGMAVEELAQATTRNARILFKLEENG